MANKTQLAAEGYVWNLATKEGFHPKDMRGTRVGYDFTLHVKDKVVRVEVKGTDREDPGIPDMRTSEFEKKRLKADFLILVHPAQAKKKDLYIIPRSDITRLKRLSTYRIQGFGKTTLPNSLQTSLGTIR